MYEAHCPCMFNIWVNAQGSGSQCVGQLPLGVLYDCRSCSRNEKVSIFSLFVSQWTEKVLLQDNVWEALP